MPDTNLSTATAGHSPVDVAEVAKTTRVDFNVIRRLGVRVLSVGSLAAGSEWTLPGAERTILVKWLIEYKKLLAALQQQGLRWLTAEIINVQREQARLITSMTADLEVILDQKNSPVSRSDSLKKVLDNKVRAAHLLATLPHLWKEAFKADLSRLTILSDIWVKQNLGTKGDHMSLWDAATFCRMCSQFSETSGSAFQSIYRSLLRAAEVSDSGVESVKNSALDWSTVS
jgi:hypothetical protein